ncbi:hypothetical protein RND71_018902 [Anisodus tanguticus]|uniref:RNase H type-1 domain-containing protein n=1 Tax=Anisodus tanguticus TaxID=243964 RepID=A0AAE1S555_9SOLA|nr:hypothetical protein RND71_018902 [Anisodus tanguticus]
MGRNFTILGQWTSVGVSARSSSGDRQSQLPQHNHGDVGLVDLSSSSIIAAQKSSFQDEPKANTTHQKNEDRIFHHCGIRGHIKKYCRKWLREIANSSGQRNNSSTSVAAKNLPEDNQPPRDKSAVYQMIVRPSNWVIQKAILSGILQGSCWAYQKGASNAFSMSQVKWKTPDQGWVKLNSDGCSKGNPGLREGGGAIRDNFDNLVMVYVKYLNIQSNNYAEAIALKTRIDWCINNGIRKLVFETDSMMPVNWILDSASIPWSPQDIILDTQNQLELFEEKSIGHCFRECHKVVDCLARFGLNCNGTSWHNNSQMLPKYVNVEISMDKIQLPSFKKILLQKLLHSLQTDPQDV